jgi:hypothetical protein
MFVGTIGIIIAGLGIVRYISLMYDSQGFGLALIGLALVNSYVFYLEKKTGVSNKVIWIKSIVSGSVLVVIAYLLYL